MIITFWGRAHCALATHTVNVLLIRVRKLFTAIGDTVDRGTLKSTSLSGDVVEKEVEFKPSPALNVLVYPFLAEFAGALLRMRANIGHL